MSIDNSDDVIDSRDVIARIEELTDERTAHIEAGTRDEWDDSDECLELEKLEHLAEEASGYAADWQHGETLIRDSYFETYAREMAEDIGAVSDYAGWPSTCIDWKRAASELQWDYTSVDFDGVTYWVR
jgi:hypothetical protein